MSPTSYQLLYPAIFCSVVPVTGLEPVQYRYRGILSPLCLPIPPHRQLSAMIRIPYSPVIVKHGQGKPFKLLSIIIKRTETQLSRLCVFSLLQPHRTEVRLTGKYRYLTFEDRKKIEAWHLLGDRPVDIAARLSVHHTTIYKELQRGATGALDANQCEGYSAELAERRLRESFKRRGKRAPATQ